jgi:hypothetical protein
MLELRVIRYSQKLDDICFLSNAQKMVVPPRALASLGFTFNAPGAQLMPTACRQKQPDRHHPACPHHTLCRAKRTLTFSNRLPVQVMMTTDEVPLPVQPLLSTLVFNPDLILAQFG